MLHARKIDYFIKNAKIPQDTRFSCYCSIRYNLRKKNCADWTIQISWIVV